MKYTTVGQLEPGQQFTFGGVGFEISTHSYDDDLRLCYIQDTTCVAYISVCALVELNEKSPVETGDHQNKLL